MLKIMAGLSGALIVGGTPAFAQHLWCWSIAGTGASATGTFVTSNDADADGFHRIIGITGAANSATITALQPTGTSIPGNSGFPVDNLVRATAPQLTKHGLGFMTSDGAYHISRLHIASALRGRQGNGADYPVQGHCHSLRC
jgi:hypothetical protein